MPKATVGKLIRDSRERLGWTQVELGERTNVSRTIVSYWESGHQLPTVPDQVNALTSALPISVEELLRAMGVNIVPAAAARLPRELVSELLATTPDQHAALLAFVRPLRGATGRGAQ